MIDLRTQIKQIRADSGHSQQAVADKAGIKQSQLSNIESLKVDPRLSTFVELALSLGYIPTLIPRQIHTAITNLMTGKPNTEPLWRIDQHDDEI